MNITIFTVTLSSPNLFLSSINALFEAIPNVHKYYSLCALGSEIVADRHSVAHVRSGLVHETVQVHLKMEIKLE